MESEKIIERDLSKGVKLKGGLSIKLLPFLFTGLPDRMVLMPGGKIYFVETKSSNGSLRPRQLYVIKQLTKLGFSVYIINSQAQLKTFLNAI